MSMHMTVNAMRAPWIGERAIAMFDQDIDYDELAGMAHERIYQLSDEDTARTVDREWIAGMLGLDDGDGNVYEYLPPLIDRVLSRKRQVCTATFGTETYWISGGLSGGDDPTEVYSALGVLGAIDPFDYPLTDDEWARLTRNSIFCETSPEQPLDITPSTTPRGPSL